VRFGVAVDDFDRVVAELERWSIAVLGAAGKKLSAALPFTIRTSVSSSR
jgi:hypothetical protein